MLPKLKRLDGVPREYEQNILIDKELDEGEDDSKMNWDLTVDKECWYTKSFPRIEKMKIDLDDTQIKKTINECELKAQKI